ncbi:MAG: hypothetical protein EOP10_06935 [Proteobacteria bacterium]|nr:MAG: hypothetical protein EOP10_06935 [Pseudomonadota bacterium]
MKSLILILAASFSTISCLRALNQNEGTYKGRNNLKGLTNLSPTTSDGGQKIRRLSTLPQQKTHLCLIDYRSTPSGRHDTARQELRGHFKNFKPLTGRLLNAFTPIDGSQGTLRFDAVLGRNIVENQGYFGSYWVLSLSRALTPSEIPLPKVTSEAVVNKNRVSVIATSGIVDDKVIASSEAVNVSNVADMEFFLLGTAFNQSHYDALLTQWSTLSLQNGVLFSAGTTTYSTTPATSARAILTGTYQWIMTDGGHI